VMMMPMMMMPMMMMMVMTIDDDDADDDDGGGGDDDPMHLAAVSSQAQSRGSRIPHGEKDVGGDYMGRQEDLDPPLCGLRHPHWRLL